MTYRYPAILSPADKVDRDREIAARNVETRRKNTAAKLQYLALVARSHGEIVTAGVVCRICGTPLTDPRSIERGIGPECRTRQEARTK